MRFRLIEAERAQHPVSLLCSVLGVTRAGFYGWKRRGPCARELRDRELCELIERIFKQSLETYGVPRIHAELADEHDVKVSRKRVARLMRRLGIEGVSRRGKRPVTTKQANAVPAASDLVRRRFQAPGPDRLWVADITYVPTWEGFLFLACVIDCWSRRCVGWSMRNDLRSELVLDALGMALTRRRPNPGLIHHSDRGSQYTSLAFGKTLQRRQRAAIDRPPRRRLRQRRRRVVLRHARDRTHRPPHLQDPRPSKARAVRVHRGLLQPQEASLGARLRVPRAL
jgi:putative transposase